MFLPQNGSLKIQYKVSNRRKKRRTQEMGNHIEKVPHIGVPKRSLLRQENSSSKLFDTDTSRSWSVASSFDDELKELQDFFTQQIKLGAYDFSKSTSENYAIMPTEDSSCSDGEHTGSQYESLRNTLDKNYHVVYQPHRRRLQDAICDQILAASHGGAAHDDHDSSDCEMPMPTEPWIVFTAGAMGVGKSHTLRWLNQKGYFPYNSFVRVDPDAIRQQLPELPGYLARPALAARAGELTNKEAGCVAELAAAAALRRGRPLLVDGSLRASGWWGAYLRRLRRRRPRYRVAILHVTAPEATVLRRARRRAAATGRRVPEDLLRRSLREVPESIRQLSVAPEVDYVIEISNPTDGGEPHIITQGEDWASFRSLWALPSEAIRRRRQPNRAALTRSPPAQQPHSKEERGHGEMEQNEGQQQQHAAVPPPPLLHPAALSAIDRNAGWLGATRGLEVLGAVRHSHNSSSSRGQVQPVLHRHCCPSPSSCSPVQRSSSSSPGPSKL